jgi:hypothetical protein
LRLSWDLHVHPGPSSVPRWGDGAQVWEAAREAGVGGFVWKSHEHHTAVDAAALPDRPVAFGSASTNPWARVDDVIAAVEAGARWVWGPTCKPDGENDFLLPLPAIWADLWPELVACGRRLVVATAHLTPRDALRVAEDCAAVEHLACSITHSAFLTVDEISALAPTGCAFEFDCFTLTRTKPALPLGSLRALASHALELGNLAYLTSDGGQASSGNPFLFAEGVIEGWRLDVGDELLETLARTGPARFVEGALGHSG